jgi:transketolase
MASALALRPAVIAPFVTRPGERVLDRAALGLAPAAAAAQGLYLLRPARGARGVPDATLVLQESGVVYAFVEQALPLLLAAGIDVEAYVVTSAELFDLQPEAVRQQVFPERKAQGAMGITGFSKPTLYRWIRSDLGRAHSLHPFQHGRFLGSGPGAAVIAEAGLDGPSQLRAIQRFVEARRARAAGGEGRPEAGVSA